MDYSGIVKELGKGREALLLGSISKHLLRCPRAHSCR